MTYPQPYPYAPRRRRRNPLAIIGYLVGTLVLMIGAGVVGYGLGQRDEIRKANALLHPTASSTATAPAVAGKPTTLLTAQGSGIKKTAKFNTGDDWLIHWSYDCTKFASGRGNFVIAVYDGNELGDVAANILGDKGHDISPVYGDPGSHYLAINSECAWTVSVTSA